MDFELISNFLPYKFTSYMNLHASVANSSHHELLAAMIFEWINPKSPSDYHNKTVLDLSWVMSQLNMAQL